MLSPLPRMRLVVLSLTLVTAAAAAHAQITIRPTVSTVGSRTLIQFGTDAGLPNSALLSVRQASDGYLWIGTWAGVSRFDGVRFTALPLRLPNLHIRVLQEDRAGAMWIGHGTGVARWYDGHLATFDSTQGLAPGLTLNITEGRQGEMWVASAGGVSRIAGSTVRAWPNAQLGGQLLGVAIGRDGQVVAATSTGFCQMSSGAPDCARVRMPAGAEHFTIDLNGRWWVGTPTGLYAVQAPAEAPCVEGCFRGRHVSRLLAESDGALTVGFLTGGVATIGGPGPDVSVLPADGMPPHPVAGIARDREGSLWLATDVSGLLQVKAPRVITIPTLGTQAMSIAEGVDGAMWAGSRCAPVATLQGDRFIVNARVGLAGSCALSVLATRAGDVWVGTEAHGLFRWDGQRLERFDASSGVESSVPALYEDSRGVVWVATTNHVHQYVNGRLSRPLGVADGLAGGAVVSFAEDHTRRVWVASNSHGLTLWENGRFRPVPEVVLPTRHISALRVDSRGDLWIGTADQGLWRLRRDGVEQIGLAEGLGDTLVALILEDEDGHIWTSTTRGIVRFDRQRIAGDIQPGVWLDPLVINRVDGMRETEGMGGGFDPSGLRTGDGRLWFSTIAGFVVIDPRRFPSNRTEPPIVIESALIDGEVGGFDAGGALRVPAGTEAIEITYTALSLAAPAQVRFRYRLAGADQSWHDVGGRRTAFYNRLRPGDYTFEVLATNSDGLWASAPAQLKVVVAPFLWQRTSVQVAGALLVLSLTGTLGHRLAKTRARRRLEELEREQALTRERTRIARDLHDDLGSRLAQIALIAQTGSSAPLDRIASTAREAMQTMDELVWSVNAKNDTVESFAGYVAEFAEEHLSLADLRVRLHFQPDLGTRQLSADTRRHLFLAFKEAVHNVVKHARASEVRVHLSVDAATLVLEVIDDGCGMPAGAARGMGNGLQNIRTRVEAVGGRVTFETRRDGGTTVRFVVPVSA